MNWLGPLLSILDRLITYRSRRDAHLRLVALRAQRRDARTRYSSHMRQETVALAKEDYRGARSLRRRAKAEAKAVTRLTERIHRIEVMLDGFDGE